MTNGGFQTFHVAICPYLYNLYFLEILINQ
jgi:hypothetical protein